MELPRQPVAANARYNARAESTRPSNELCVVVRTSRELPELVQRNERVKERSPMPRHSLLGGSILPLLLVASLFAQHSTESPVRYALHHKIRKRRQECSVGGLGLGRYWEANCPFGRRREYGSRI